MTTIHEKSAGTFEIEHPSEEGTGFLIATENYGMAADELRSAMSDLRAALANLSELFAEVVGPDTDSQTSVEAQADGVRRS